MHQWLGYEVGLTAGGRVRHSILDSNPQEAGGLAASMVQDDEPSTPLASNIPGVWFLPDHVAVVNPSPRESETERCPPEEFENRFALKFVSSADDAGDETPINQATDLRRDEIWHWIACALLGVLLLEGFVGNRTTA
jgi:hypothetical protein